jgi:hypothetical protein
MNTHQLFEHVSKVPTPDLAVLVQCEANFLHRVRHAGDDIRKYDQLFSLAKSELARRGALSAVDLDAPEDETGEDWKG